MAPSFVPAARGAQAQDLGAEGLRAARQPSGGTRRVRAGAPKARPLGKHLQERRGR